MTQAFSPNEWYPIATAPLDGTRVLLYQADNGSQHTWVSSYEPEDDAFSDPTNEWLAEPTHWSPLIPPPIT